MFNESIDLLWLAIALAVLVVSGFTAYLIFHLAHLVRESKRTVEDVNGKMKRVDPALDALTSTAQELSKSVESLRTNVIEPIAGIGGFLKGILNFKNAFSGLTSAMGGSKNETEEDEA